MEKIKHVTNSVVYVLTDDDESNKMIIDSIQLIPIMVKRAHGDNAKAVNVEEELIFGTRDGKSLVQKQYKYNVQYEL